MFPPETYMLLNYCYLLRKGYLLIFAFLLLYVSGALAQDKNAPYLKKLKKINDLDSVKTYADSLLKIARSTNDKLFEGKIWLVQSNKFYRQGEGVAALDYAQKAASATSPKDSDTYVRAQIMIAYMQGGNGDNEAALKTAFNILKETEKTNWVKLRINCKVCISDLYRPLHDVQSALPFALQATQEALAIKDTGLYIYAISTLSNVYSTSPKSGKQPSADYLQKAIVCLQTVLKPPYVHKISVYDEAKYLGNLGRLYEKQDKLNDAEDALNRSLVITRREKFAALEKHNLNELMTVAMDKEDYKKAIDYGHQALAILSNANSNRTLQKNIYAHLSDSYEVLKNYEQAYKYAVKERMLNDSILSADQSRIAGELNKKYQADKRLLLVAGENKLLQQQRDYITLIAALVFIALIGLYRWFLYKKKKEAAVLAEEHNQLARLDAMKSKFFANISHELKTPLTLVMGPAEQLLNNDVPAGQQKKSLMAITRNSRKLLDIVNELLDLGKIEAGSMVVKPRPVNLAALVKVIYQGFASAAEYKNINYTLATDIDEKLYAQLDREKFEKIANNFISNAIKFTPPSKTVNVAAIVQDNLIGFSVEDNGKGIHPDDVDHIFDRYYQGRREDDPAEGGTGIGLSIAKEFAELMGGRITIDNHWGEGTVFKVYIPLLPVTVQDSEAAIGRDIEIMPPPVNKKQLVLLVEDHEEMAGYISSVLSPYYTIATAVNGIKALEFLAGAGSLPNIIISDVMMPGMDGFTLLDKLKAHPAYFRIPVIMLTALADSRNKLRALTIGVDDYLTKPFLSSELLARTQNLLTNAAGRDVANYQETEGAPIIENATEVSEEDITEDTLTMPSHADVAWLNSLEEQVRKFVGKTDLNLAILSYEMAISERQLFRRIKSITGLTPNKYIRTIRLQIAREAIESGKYRTIAEISFVAGFDTPAYFSKLFREFYGRDVNDLL